MKIDGFSPSPAGNQPGRVENTDSSSVQNRTEAGRSIRDESCLEADLEGAKQVERALRGLADIRQERVQSLQQAVRAGRYQVSDSQIAGAMFSELLG